MGWLFLLIADTVFSDSADLMTNFLPTFLQLSNLADSFRSFHKINTPLYRYTCACTCIDMHVDTYACTHKLTHAQRHACISYSSSDKEDFLPHNFKAFLVLTEYPTILLLQRVLVCEEVFSNIFF